MINLQDEKGKPLGLDYDYEYRGARYEGNRDAPLTRTKIVWMIFAIIFSVMGLIIIFDYLKGTADTSLGGVVFLSVFCFGVTVLFLWLMRSQTRKHKDLLDVIKQQKNS